MADSYGIPVTIINKSTAIWQTKLDNYSPDTHDLLWFLKPANTIHWYESVVGSPYNGGWQTSLELNTDRTNWVWEAKVRAKDGHAVTALAEGELECVVVLSAAEEKVNAVRDALIAIGEGKKVQSYEIAGRQLKNYSLTELQALYTMLKAELQAEQSRNRRKFGVLHGNFGSAHRGGWGC